MLDEKKKQASSIVFLIDSSSSMIMADEVGLQKRWVVAKKALDSATKAMEGKSKDLEVKVYRFDTDLHDYKAEDTKDPNGRETDLGSMLLKAVKDNSGSSRVTSVVLLSDGASNGGISPLVAANQLRANLIPVVTVGVPRSSSRISPRSGGRSRSEASAASRSRSNSTSIATRSQWPRRRSTSRSVPRSSP
jgi:hypothetical protein